MVLDEISQAEADIWKFAFGFITKVAVKTSVNLQIQEALAKHGGSASLSDLAAEVGIPHDHLRRIMRFMIHQGIFKHAGDDHYSDNALSRLLTRDKMAAFMLLHGDPPPTLSGLTADTLRTGKRPDVKPSDGEDTWTDAAYGNHMKVFTDAMEAHARVTTSKIVANHPEVFKGMTSVVDVGGRHGMALSCLLQAFPSVRGICLDLPEVVAKAPPRPGVEFVGGSMFESVPKADAIMLMWVLHDWSDSSFVEILKKCKEAIPPYGKVIIVDAVVDEDGSGDEYYGARLALDMIMMATTVQGKERTHKEFIRLLDEAGFRRHTVKNIKTVEHVIEAYP
nr:flavonoid O-methyltransferase 3 [Dracocephalum moldavica]